MKCVAIGANRHLMLGSITENSDSTLTVTFGTDEMGDETINARGGAIWED